MNDPSRFSGPAHPLTKPKVCPHLTLTPKTAPAFFAKHYHGKPVTTWDNELVREQAIDSLVLPQHVRDPACPTGRFVVLIPAGESCEIPSCFDRAILVVEPEGTTIIGGLAPGLRPRGCAYSVHEALLENNDLFTPPEAA